MLVNENKNKITTVNWLAKLIKQRTCEFQYSESTWCGWWYKDIDWNNNHLIIENMENLNCLEIMLFDLEDIKGCERVLSVI